MCPSQVQVQLASQSVGYSHNLVGQPACICKLGWQSHDSGRFHCWFCKLDSNYKFWYTGFKFYILTLTENIHMFTLSFPLHCLLSPIELLSVRTVFKLPASWPRHFPTLIEGCMANPKWKSLKQRTTTTNHNKKYSIVEKAQKSKYFTPSGYYPLQRL